MEASNHFHSSTVTVRRGEGADNPVHGNHFVSQTNPTNSYSLDSPSTRNMKGRHAPGATWMTFLIVFIGTSELYCGYRFIVPMYFTEYGEWAPFYMKVFMTFVYVEILANWFCVKHFHPFYFPEENTAVPDQASPWEEFENKPRPDPRYSQLKLRLDGTELPDDASQRLSREIALLSWRHCNACQMMAPPRSHHCTVCGRCVLKRDHHCFLTGTCIGFFNQRYFVVLNFYLIIAMWGGTFYLYKYMSDTFYDRASILDYFLPVLTIKCLMGDFEHQYFFMICFCYTFWWVGILSIGFLGWQIWTISFGKTPYELRKKLCIRNTESLSERIKSVFGACWPVNFLFPAVILFPQEEDGTTWQKLKIIYKYRPRDNSNDDNCGSRQYVIKMENNQVICDIEKHPDVNII